MRPDSAIPTRPRSPWLQIVPKLLSRHLADVPDQWKLKSRAFRRQRVPHYRSNTSGAPDMVALRIYAQHVDEDWGSRQFRPVELVKTADYLLNATERGKAGRSTFLPRCCPAHRRPSPSRSSCVVHLIVVSVGVGGLHDQRIDRPDGGRDRGSSAELGCAPYRRRRRDDGMPLLGRAANTTVVEPRTVPHRGNSTAEGYSAVRATLVE